MRIEMSERTLAHAPRHASRDLEEVLGIIMLFISVFNGLLGFASSLVDFFDNLNKPTNA